MIYGCYSGNLINNDCFRPAKNSLLKSIVPLITMKILILVFVTIASAQFPQRTGRRKYAEDSGKYAQDDSGKYIYDNSGAYEPDYSGQYVPDDSGKYYPDDSGKYIPDDSGKYYPDYTGMYVTDKSGRYNYDEVLRQHKAKQIRKSRSISSEVPVPNNMYLPSVNNDKIETPNYVAVDTSNNQKVNRTIFLNVTAIEGTNKTTSNFTQSQLFPYASSYTEKSNGGGVNNFVGARFKPNDLTTSSKYGGLVKISPRYPKLEEILKPTLRKLMGYGFSIIYNKINRSHIVVNYGPNQNFSQKLIPSSPSRGP